MNVFECSICKKSFETKARSAKYCPECRAKKIYRCTYCTTPMREEQAIVEDRIGGGGGKHRYCSEACREAKRRALKDRPVPRHVSARRLRFDAGPGRRDDDEGGPWNENARRNLEGDD